MRNQTRSNSGFAAVAALAFAAALCQPTAASAQGPAAATAPAQQPLTAKQRGVPPIGAAMAAGDMPRLNAALNQGLDAGLTVGDTKEILVQLYAYAGFPRSLNALGELMKVVDARKQRGVQDALGHLSKRKLIAVERKSITAVPVYTVLRPWRR